MSELEKKIIGDWVDIRESSKHLFSITDFFKLTKEELAGILEKLRLSNEQGIIEYKLSSLARLFRVLEDVRYKSVSLDTLTAHASGIRHLVFVTLIQKLITQGVIALTHTAGAEEKISAESIEITLILKDILARIKENPELKKHLAVKNILVQFAVYNREKETLDKLKNTANTKSAFYKNFKETFDKIFTSIRRNYSVILKEEAAPLTRKNVLSLIRLASISPLLNNQARLFSRIATTISFVQTDKFKTREILVGLLDKKNEFLDTIESETRLYQEMGKAAAGNDPAAAGNSIANAFINEIIRVIEKYIEKEYPTEEVIE